jgi:hypothetical protein
LRPPDGPISHYALHQDQIPEHGPNVLNVVMTAFLGRLLFRKYDRYERRKRVHVLYLVILVGLFAAAFVAAFLLLSAHTARQ